MLLGTHTQYTTYNRHRNGVEHTVSSKRTMYDLQCDACGAEFSRTSIQFNRRSGTHVCGNCDQKSFAQSQSKNWRKFNRTDASSGIRVTDL